MKEYIVNFNERCRLCIEPKRLSIDIFSEEGRRIKLDNKINKHLSIKILESDDFSNLICYQCLFRLETWVSFKQLCAEREQVMKTWSQTFSKIKINKLNEDHSSNQVIQKDSNEKRTKSSPQKSTGSSSKSFTTKNKKVPVQNITVDTPITEKPVSSEMISHEENFEMKLDVDTIGQASETMIISNSDITNSHPNAGCSPTCSVILPDVSYQTKYDYIKRKKQKSLPSNPSTSSVAREVKTYSPMNRMFIRKTEGKPLLSTSNIDEENIDSAPEIQFQKNGSPPPLKRKRGRPSKAFLQMERHYKRLKERPNPGIPPAANPVSPPAGVNQVFTSGTLLHVEQHYRRIKEKENPNPIIPPAIVHPVAPPSMVNLAISPAAVNPDIPPSAVEMVNSHSEQDRDSEKSFPEESFPEEPFPEESFQTPQVQTPQVSQEMIPVTHEETGVTEVVLNDPDFGSMKFTLSLVGIDSPVSSPPAIEDYHHHPETCDLKEDFEGFETSELPEPHVTELSHHQTSEMLSESLPDSVYANCDDMNRPSSCEPKDSNSASCDFIGNSNASASVSSVDFKLPCMSKSLENLHTGLESNSKRRSYFVLRDRMSHSDGEMSDDM